MGKSRKTRKQTGICKLTGTEGVFVDSHLIPKALTRPDKMGLPFIQYGSGTLSRKRWSSWYDPQLVTQSGEMILSAIDTWAIAELRGKKLVWSGWGDSRTLGSLHHPISGTPWGIRKLEGINRARLRLFFLTLLWRAAVTALPEFSEVDLPPEDLEQLRQMICLGNVEPISFYPAQLTQLSTLGVIHNHTPIAQMKTIPSLDSTPPRDIPIFRFYFDGLIAHIHRQSSDDGYTSDLGNLIVGAEETLVINTQTYEESFQQLNMESVISEAS
jgi:hypothetical protein